MRAVRRLAPGILAVAAVALAGFAVAHAAAPFVRLEASLLALLFGLALGALLRHPPAIEPGAQFTLKRALTWGVILLGAEVNLAFLVSAGPAAVVLSLILVPLTLAAFWLLARLLKMEGDSWALLGAGTGICGLSAVIAAGATLKSREQDIAVAAAAVGILSAVGLVAYPLIALLAPMAPDVYGAWSGLSLHAVANAVAAGLAGGEEAGKVAALTKFARVALLAPALVGLALVVRHKARAKASRATLLPPMVWGFVLAALLVSFLPVPAPLLEAVRLLTRALLLLGLAGIGYTTRLAHIRDAGPRAITLAVAGWALLSVAALAGAVIAYG